LNHLAKVVLVAALALFSVSPALPRYASLGHGDDGRSIGGGGLDSSVYYSFANLEGNSTVIAWGNVTGMVSAYYGDKLNVTVVTVFGFNIMKFAKGSAADSIFVVDLGGTLGKVTFGYPGSPLLTVGGSYVLFLSNNWRCAPSPPSPPCILPPTPLSTTYYIVANEQGKFVLQNGLVYGMKTLYPQYDYNLAFDADGVPIDQFLSEVSSSGNPYFTYLAYGVIASVGVTAISAAVILRRRRKSAKGASFSSWLGTRMP
jgi:hypothetical protein